VAPRITLQPNMMLTVLVYALAAAAFGGLDSVGGAALGGFVVGLLNSVILGYISDVDRLSSLTAAPLLFPVVLLLVVLWFKPTGLFGTKSVERV
jgi:branched-chain amino acid transport system permease protein